MPTPFRILIVATAFASGALAQTPPPIPNGPLRAPATATAGGTVDVEVASAAHDILVMHGGDLSWLSVPANKTVTIPVPATPGEVLTVSVGQGASKHTIQITIV